MMVINKCENVLDVLKLKYQYPEIMNALPRTVITNKGVEIEIIWDNKEVKAKYQNKLFRIILNYDPYTKKFTANDFNSNVICTFDL